MRTWLIDFIRRLLICCVSIMAIAVLFPVEHKNPPRQPSQQEAHQDAVEAGRDGQRVYGRMSDQDKMTGVVLEPVDGE